MPLPNYIKFQRGTSTAYNNLSVKDQNTLYFILDPGEEHGKLYLGERLIGSDLGNGTGVSSIAELSDVLINEAHAGDFLVLNSAGKWINQSASDVAAIILNSEGFVSDIDENEFNLNAVSGKLELNGFNDATAGMMPVKSDSGILSWENAPPDLSSRVGDLETGLNSLTSELQTVQQTILGLNHLSYQVISDLNDATDSNIIYLYPKTDSATNDTYDEYMLINNSLEKIGSTSTDLSNYVTTSQLQTAFGDLETELNSLTSDLQTVQQTILGLNHLSYQVISDLNDATESNIIYLYPKTDSATNDIYDEYMLINNSLEKIGSTSTDLSNYVTTPQLQTAVGNLETKLNNYVLKTTFQSVVGNLTSLNAYNNLSENASITDILGDVYERLIWQEISE